MSIDKIFYPKIGLIVENNPSKQKFFSEWMQRNYRDIKISFFDQQIQSQNWITLNKELILKKPLLAFIDIDSPSDAGFNLIKEITNISKLFKVIAISSQDKDQNLFKALRSGASGFIFRNTNQKDLEKTLTRITEGECPFSPSVLQKIVTYFHSESASQKCPLTSREKEVLKYIAKGLTVKQTASEMRIKASTVSSYIKIIYQKLHITNRAQATQRAISLGLV